MNKKDLLKVNDLSRREIFDILTLSMKLKKSPFAKRKALKNKTLALLFQKPSNRTRISFEVAMTHLGGYTLYLSPQEISMGARESVKDVGCVISRYVSGMVARVFSHSDVETLATYSSVPVINGLSDLEHPCQALGDIFTIKERFGSFKKIKIAFVGDGNNVLNSLLVAAAHVGLSMNVATPRGYEPTKDILGEAISIGKDTGAIFELFLDPQEAVRGCDVIYTDVWVSMGQEDEREKRLRDFAAFQVNGALLRATGKDALIMHCLPAHRGEEITDVIDSKSSIVYDQAENRMHVQKAVLLKLLAKKKQ